MRIYTHIVLDIETGAIVSSKGFDYAGPVAECKGGGGSVTNTTDPVYNQGLLNISKEQQAMAAKLFNMYMYGVEYDPNEVVMGKEIDGRWYNEDELMSSPYSSEYYKENPAYAEYEKQLAVLKDIGYSDEQAKTHLASQGITSQDRWLRNENLFDRRTRGEMEGYDPNAQVSEAKYYQNLIEANQSLLGSQTEAELANLGLTMDQIQAQRQLLPAQTQTELAKLQDTQTAIAQRAPIRQAYADAVMEPIDANRKMNQAQAGVQHAYDLSGKQFERQMFAAGVNPSDPGYAAAINSRGLSMSRDIAAARTTARDQAEETKFNRLQGAMSSGF